MRVNLTKREIRCLVDLLEGTCTDETAAQLYEKLVKLISPRG